MDSININIAGDLFLGRRVESPAENNPETLFDENIYNLFASSNFNIVNLESALTFADEKHKILKTGPNIKASPNTIGVLDLLKINLVTLANNHIYDYGEKGLSDTLDLCKKHNISTVGAGLTFGDASETFFKKIGNVMIGVVNITENEWSNANEFHGGANPMNIVANIRSLREAKKIADIVILIVHGGNEGFHYPSPRMVDQYHFYAEEGASIIIGHHSHCISGFEIYEKVPIFYGLGNFLFDAKTDFAGWFEGILLNIKINERKEISWKLYPYKQCKKCLKVEFPNDNEKLMIENKILAINEIIADPEKLKAKYTDLVKSQAKHILSIFSTSYILNYKYLRSAIRKLGLERFFIRRDQLKLILNSTRCESLKDVSLGVIENYLKTK